MIKEFKGDYDWLSNFYPCEIEYQGATYPCVENAFQAAKTDNLEERKQFETLSPAAAKKAGRKVTLRDDWEVIKIIVMHVLIKKKFNHADLGLKLIATGEATLQEGNYWGDTFWGVCKGVGENKLGEILMTVRGEVDRKVYHTMNHSGLKLPKELVKCKKCGGEPYEAFEAYEPNLVVVIYAMIECYGCDNQSECFQLPQSLFGSEEAGSLIERLAVLDWNTTNK